MGNGVKTDYELFQFSVEMDIPSIINQVFSGKVRFGGIQIAEVSEASELRLYLAQKGRLNPESDQLLRRILTEHLEIGQHYARARNNANPNPTELLDLYEAQVHAMERWQLFYRVAERLADIQEAYQVAFIDYQPEPLGFDTPATRTAWLQVLVNEQQRDILQNQMVEVSKAKPSYWLEGREFFYQGRQYHMSPTNASLLMILLDGQFYSTEELIRKTMGTRAAGKLERDRLSINISRLNTKLKEISGRLQRDKQNWINRQAKGAVNGYQLNTELVTGI
jgi:hypothetical protein